MKKLIFIFTYLTIAHAFSSSIQIIAQYDKNNVIVNYIARSWNGKDHAMIETFYKIPEAQAVFGSLLNGAILGTSDSPSRITLIYSEDGSIERVVAQVTSVKSDKLETVEQPLDLLDDQVKIDADKAKTDIETKTGKDIGGDLKP